MDYKAGVGPSPGASRYNRSRRKPEYFTISAIGQSSVRSAMFIETPANGVFLTVRSGMCPDLAASA